jgi:hypothetical protein
MAKKIQVNLEVDTKKGTTNIKKFSRTTDKLAKDASKSADKMNKSFLKVNTALKLMTAAAAAFVAVKLVSLIGINIRRFDGYW